MAVQCVPLHYLTKSNKSLTTTQAQAAGGWCFHTSYCFLWRYCTSGGSKSTCYCGVPLQIFVIVGRDPTYALRRPFKAELRSTVYVRVRPSRFVYLCQLRRVYSVCSSVPCGRPLPLRPCVSLTDRLAALNFQRVIMFPFNFQGWSLGGPSLSPRPLGSTIGG